MEVYKRKVGYEDFSRTSNLIVTATTLYFPFLLTQNFEDIGLYTDTDNPVYEIVNLNGIWDLSNTGSTASGSGVEQKVCLVLNNCTINFTSTPITYYNANNGTLSASITTSPTCPGPQTVEWIGPNGFTSTNLTAGMNNLSSGSYTIKVTDANCDMSYATYFLQQPQSLSLTLNSNNSQTNVTTPGGCNGTANVFIQGGLPPYNYLWYSGNTSNVVPGTNSSTTGVTNLCAGTYNVQVTDANNTIVSGLFSITEPQPVLGSVTTTTNIDCAGGNTGSISVTASGGIHPNGYTFILTGPTPQTISGNTSGNVTFSNLLGCPTSSPCYSVQILDNIGNNTILPPILISQPVAVNLGVSYNDSGCFNSSTGTITLTPNGGTPPYTINTNTFGTQTVSGPITFNNLQAGTYTASIQDSNGCVGPTQTVNIKQRPLLNVSVATPSTFNGYNIRCYSATTAITVTSSYTSNPTTYPVSSNTMKYYLDGVLKTTAIGPGVVTLTNVSAGNHKVTVVDSAICSASTNVTLTQPPMPLSFVGSNTITSGPGAPYTSNIDIINIFSGCTPACTGLNVGPCLQAIVGVNGGVTPYNITWTMLPGNIAWGNGIVSNPFCTYMGGSAYQLLTVKVVDTNGCVITSSINV